MRWRHARTATKIKPFSNTLWSVSVAVELVLRAPLGGLCVASKAPALMDDLLRDFLTETGESLDVVDVELVRFEQEPNNTKILDNIFRLVHTIKGTCGFLGLPRLEALTHAAEALMGNFRGGRPVTSEAVTLVLATIDRIKALLDELERNQTESEGNDQELIAQLQRMTAGAAAAPPAVEAPAPRTSPRAEHDVLIPPEMLERAVRMSREAEGRAIPPTAGGRAAAAPQGTLGPAADKPDTAGRDDDRPDAKVANQSIRVHVDTLEYLMTMVSELVLTRNQLIEIVRRHEDSEFKAPLQRLSNVTAELQEGVLKTRMQPIGNAWQKLPRIVRDLSAELDKPIELEMYGADTELDRQVLDLIKDPLTHMVRNSADHGLEMPAQRLAAGKPERGTIRLSACHEGGHIIIEISDDGRGLDIERIRAKALSVGVVSEAEIEKLTDAQVQNFIFAAGFSTAETVTSVSGRGIGMDVVRANIDQIGGTIDVKTIRGRGTTFTIKIPLTLAIVSALIVQAGGDRFAIPQLAVLELVRVRSNSEHRIEHIKGAAVLRLRNKLLPLVTLKTLLDIADPAEAKATSDFIVVTQVGSQTFGIVVDGVFHTEEIVVKPMSSRLRHIAMFCGNTILGDGSVILIIDPNGVVQTIGMAEATRQIAGEDRGAAVTEEAATESMLVFRAGSPNPMAVPLSLVTRLEEIDAKTIEMSSGRPLVQYRGQLMPLVPVNADVRIRTSGTQPLLVFSDDDRSMGLVVDEIVDIVDDRLDIELATERPGLIGSAVIKGQATDIIDIAHYLPLAFEDWRSWKERGADKQTRNVLLIDDAPFFRNMLAPVLKAAGYAVVTAASAEDALALVDGGRSFDVVITDIEMPGMDGFDLALALRGNPRTADMPIIGLSTMVSEQAIERGKRVGLHDYVAKFDRQGLIAALKEQTAGMSNAA
jgi:two-component system, chemotaxis family, sensor kinase CheA